MAIPGSIVEEALRYADALYNHARRLTRNPADAEELVQETFTRALASAHSFSGGNLKAWMFRILQNLFIDAQRHDSRHPTLSELDVLDGAIDAGVIHHETERAAIRSLLTGELEAALAKLSADARAIVLLDVEGFSESEIAEVIGCPQGTVKSRLSRARVLLRRELRDYAPAAARRDTAASGDE